MTDTTPAPTLPDRLSTDPRSPHHVAALFEKGIGIRFNDKERFDVEEYCISEGWIKVPAGKAVDRRGQPLLIKLKGQGRGLPALKWQAVCRRVCRNAPRWAGRSRQTCPNSALRCAVYFHHGAAGAPPMKSTAAMKVSSTQGSCRWPVAAHSFW